MSFFENVSSHQNDTDSRFICAFLNNLLDTPSLLWPVSFKLSSPSTRRPASFYLSTHSTCYNHNHALHRIFGLVNLKLPYLPWHPSLLVSIVVAILFKIIKETRGKNLKSIILEEKVVQNNCISTHLRG